MVERVVRLTYFAGVLVPMVEIWTHAGEACDGGKRYDYLRTGHIPVCETQAEWLEMLRNAETSLLQGLEPDSVAARSWGPDAEC